MEIGYSSIMATRKDEEEVAAGIERRKAAILDMESSHQAPDLAASSQNSLLECFR